MARRKGSKSRAPLTEEQRHEVRLWYLMRRQIGGQKEFAQRAGITEAQIQVELRKFREEEGTA